MVSAFRAGPGSTMVTFPSAGHSATTSTSASATAFASVGSLSPASVDAAKYSSASRGSPVSPATFARSLARFGTLSGLCTHTRVSVAGGCRASDQAATKRSSGPRSPPSARSGVADAGTETVSSATHRLTRATAVSAGARRAPAPRAPGTLYRPEVPEHSRPHRGKRALRAGAPVDRDGAERGAIRRGEVPQLGREERHLAERAHRAKRAARAGTCAGTSARP